MGIGIYQVLLHFTKLEIKIYQKTKKKYWTLLPGLIIISRNHKKLILGPFLKAFISQIKTLEKMAANTHRNKDVRKAIDNLIRVVQNSPNSEEEIQVTGSNSISTSNSILISSSNSVSSVMERTQSMIQASSHNFKCLRSNERFRASGKTTLLHEL